MPPKSTPIQTELSHQPAERLISLAIVNASSTRPRPDRPWLKVLANGPDIEPSGREKATEPAKPVKQ
jgi:hypothetical protein